MGKPSWKPSGVAPASSRAPWSFMFTKRSLSPKYREMLSPIIVMSGRQAPPASAASSRCVRSPLTCEGTNLSAAKRLQAALSTFSERPLYVYQKVR